MELLESDIYWESDEKLEDAKLLCATHMWDLENGGEYRDWGQIILAAGIKGAQNDVASKFLSLRTATDVIFPYPIIVDRSIPIRRNQNIGSQNRLAFSDYEPREKESHCGIAARYATWEEKVQDIMKAVAVLPHWAMKCWNFRRFFGFHERPEKLEESESWYADLLKEAICRSPPAIQSIHNEYFPGEETLKGVADAETEFAKLLTVFYNYRECWVDYIHSSTSVQELTEIAYYRRQVYDWSGNLVRMAMSDLELMTLYVKGIRDEFQFESLDLNYWKRYLERIGIRDVQGVHARSDFFKLFLPRLELLKRWLAPPGFNQSIHLKTCAIAVQRVIYHSMKAHTFSDVLMTIVSLHESGLIDLQLLGGVGYHICTFIFIMLILRGRAAHYDTGENEFRTTRTELVKDILENFCRFKYGNLQKRRY